MTTVDERLFHGAIATLELYSVYLGDRLGLYQVLRERGALTPGELADAASIAPRYAREWLEQQAVAGLLTVDRADLGPDRRRYALPADHVGPLCEREALDHVAPLAQMLVGIAGTLPRVVDAYRDGGGLSFADFGPDMGAGQAAINRPAFTRDLTGSWLPAAPALHRRLERGARVADAGCGQGWSTIAVARAYPASSVVGFDPDLASIEAARSHARAAGVGARFEPRDATALAEHGPFDVVMVLEALHDMSRPGEMLAAIRAALAPGGAVFIADERVAERFTAPGDELERMMYGWSVSHCLPAAMGDHPCDPTGTAIRPDDVRRLAADAGFAGVEVLPIEATLFRFYLLTT